MRSNGAGRRDWLRRLPTIVAAVRFARSMTTPLGRGRISAIRRGAHLYQPATTTRADRHPVLVEAVAAALRDATAPRLLSFGCSTGEEAFDLARALPRAQIDAIDANPACISQASRTARRIGADARTRFACADAPDAFPGQVYDAVFCLSVLRHGDLDAWVPDSATALMPFTQFVGAVEALDARVRPGGLLILWGCNFRFGDTPVANRYRALPVPDAPPQPGPFWGADDLLLNVATYDEFVFVKRF